MIYKLQKGRIIKVLTNTVKKSPGIKLLEPLKINSNITSLQDNIFKEAVKRAGTPVIGRIGQSPIGGTQLLSAMMTGTYVEPPANTYGGLKLNPNYYYRRGWGIIDDALDTGVIRVPESGYIDKALEKYPWLNNGNPFSTTLIGQSFPYFSEGTLWPAGGKFGVEPTDLIAIPKGLPWVNWVAGSKWGVLRPYNKPSQYGGRATPLIEGKTNLFPTKHALLYKLDPDTKEYIKYKNGGTVKLQKAWTKIPKVLRKAIKGFGKTIDKTTTIPAQVKYYGPTMGKTTSIRTNPSLVDFDAIMRDPSKELLKKYGFDSKYQMFESGNQDAIKEYQDLLVRKMNEFKFNPNNSGKTLIVSQSPVVNPEDTGFQFDNEPSIPSKDVFVSRNVERGGTTLDSEDWWTNLIQRNPNLKIDNRFVSDIEGSKELIHVPKIVIPDIRTYYLVDSSMPLSRPISEAEIKGQIKQFRNQKRGQISGDEYSGLPKGERNNGRYGDIRFIRHMDVVPEITEDGFVQIAPKENFFANFTTDQLMVPHQGYPISGIGKNVIIIDPEAFRGITPLSLDPSDSFFLNQKLKIKPKHVTFISGDKEALQLAKERGFNIESSPKLKILSRFIDPASMDEQWAMKPALEKKGYWSFGSRNFFKLKSDYVDELRRILDTRFPRPSIDDYRRLETVTNVPTNVYPNIRGGVPKDVYFYGPKKGYKQVIYDTTSPIEGAITKSLHLYPHPTDISEEPFRLGSLIRINNWLPIKKQGGILKAQNGDLIGPSIKKH